jgi:hypothetical protein
MTAPSRLVIRNRGWAIRVTGWDREEIKLTAEIRDSAGQRIELGLNRTREGMEIEAQFPAGASAAAPSAAAESELKAAGIQIGGRVGAASAWGRAVIHSTGSGSVVSVSGPAAVFADEAPSSNMTLFVPHRIALLVQNASGAIEIRSMAGAVEVAATNAPLAVHHLQGRITGRTTNAVITLEDVEGGVALETTNGAINASRLDGRGEGIRLKTRNAGISVSLGSTTGEIHGSYRNGKCTVELPSATVLASARFSFSLLLPGPVHQRIDLETTNGNVTLRP